MRTLRVCEYTKLDDLCERQWAALSARPPASLSGSRPWVEAAFGAQHPNAEPLLVAIESDLGMVALLPLAVHQSEGTSTARVAAAPRNDLADLLVLPGHALEVGPMVMSALCEITSRGVTIDLENIDPAGALAAADAHLDLAWTPCEVAPVIDLRSSGSRAPISLRHRRRWTGMLSTLWRGQQVEFRRITGVDVVSRFPEFMRLRETRLRSVGRTIDRLRDRSIQAMLTALANRGNVQILQMVVNASVAAADLYLVEQPVAMLRLRALDPTMSRFECGHLLLRAAIDTFAGEGYETLDLGRGAEAYKFLFGAHERVLLRAKRDGLTR